MKDRHQRRMQLRRYLGQLCPARVRCDALTFAAAGFSEDRRGGVPGPGGQGHPGLARGGLVLVMAVVWWWCLSSSALGAGFALVNQGTAAMAQGNAFVAEASDASAIYYNPAGISQLKRPQFYMGTFINYPDREFHGDAGEFSQTNHRFYRSLSAYFAAPVNDWLAVGIGFFTPFGLGTVWPPTWAGRYLTTYTDLRTYNLNPVICVKPLKNLALAVGLDVLWSSVRLKRKVPLPLGLPDGEVNLGGDGEGFGYNIGFLYEPLTGVKLGVSYRSEITVTYHGDLITTLPRPLVSTGNSGKADLTFPPSVTFGINYARLQPLALEFDVTWTGWSSYDRLEVSLGSPTMVNNVRTTTIATPKNWRDAWAFRFGANYEVKPGMKLRTGYTYDLTPVPDATMDPMMPDANRHIFAVGGDLKIKRFTLGIAYNYILLENRTKTSAVTFNGVAPPLQANGRYQSDVHSLGLSWSFQF